MPAEECNNGKWKWGETGECKYETQEEAEEDNEDYYEQEKDMKINKRHIISVTEDEETYTIVYEKDREDTEMEENSERRDINKLNQSGYDNALALVKANKINRDGDWDFSADDGNELLGADSDDWSNYSKWFLGIDTNADNDTKGYYGYPYGKNGVVY